MEINDASLKEFRKILTWVLANKYSDFYREKYKGTVTPSKIKTAEDFKKIPFLTRQDLTRKSPFERLFIPMNKVKGISMSSGTTGAGPLVNFFREWRIRFGGKKISVLDLASLAPDVRKLKIQRVFNLRSTFSVNMYMNLPFNKFGSMRIYGDIHNLGLSAQVAAKLEIDGLNMPSTTLYFFTPYLKAVYDLRKIRYISIGGEHCSQAKLNLIKKTYPNAYIIGNYGGSEDGTRGWQCKIYRGKNMSIFHALPYTIFECLDTENGENLNRGNLGELVITSLDKNQFVTIRYRTGDLVQIKKEKCKCGSKDPLFEVFGRVGVDSITMQGATLLTSDVLKAIDKTKVLTADFKAHIYEKIVRGRIYYQIELWCVPKDKKNLGSTAFIKRVRDKIENNVLVSSTLTYHDLVQKDVLLPLKLVFTEEFPFEAKRKHFITHY